MLFNVTDERKLEKIPIKTTKLLEKHAVRSSSSVSAVKRGETKWSREPSVKLRPDRLRCSAGLVHLGS